MKGGLIPSLKRWGYVVKNNKVVRVRRILFSGILCFLILFISGFQFPEPSKKNRVAWPLPPDPPRISYVMTIEKARDAGVRKSIFRRFVEIFTGKGPEPKIHRPISVVSDGKGTVYISDVGLQVIHVFDFRHRKYKQIFKLNGETPPSRLLSPTGIAIDPKKNLYVVDSILKKVFVFDKKGRHIFTIRNKAFVRPSSLAYDGRRKRLYIADAGAHKIWIYERPNGKMIISSMGKRGKGKGEFNFPTHLALDEKGNLYVTDALNFRIQIFNPEGKFIGSIGKLGYTLGTFSRPKGVAVDREGNIYVVDNLYDTVQVFNSKGDLLMNFATHGGGKGGLWLPNGIYIDKDNYIFVADTYNERVQVFRKLK